MKDDKIRFGLPYDFSSYERSTLSQFADISPEEAEKIRDQVWKAFPKLKHWLEKQRKKFRNKD